MQRPRPAKVTAVTRENYGGTTANANSVTALVTATICVLSGCAGRRAFVDLDKAIFEFFKGFYHDYFPKLSCRVSFVRQAATPPPEAHDWVIILEAKE